MCSSELTCLRLACCKFVNNEVIKLIGNSCSNLTGTYAIAINIIYTGKLAYDRLKREEGLGFYLAFNSLGHIATR